MWPKEEISFGLVDLQNANPSKMTADSHVVVAYCSVMMQWPREEYSFSLVDL